MPTRHHRLEEGDPTNIESVRNIYAILLMADRFEWTVQGFGMFRLYLSDRVRLHVWDHRFRVVDVSDIHDHPWDLHSEVIAGQVVNVIFRKVVGDGAPNYMEQRIVPGPGGGPNAEPVPVTLRESTAYTYRPGDWYSQSAETLHRTKPNLGTVTLASRENRQQENVALSYFERGKDKQWVSAEPRIATKAEVHQMQGPALKQLMNVIKEAVT